ncbi:MDR family MFS transporter [Rhodococcus wratislaviensis]|uniref:MDR family MFS transporter n=1 Tax=Rhodococcus wratislaviensis TaxID=44752 RepID=UPI003661726B
MSKTDTKALKEPDPGSRGVKLLFGGLVLSMFLASLNQTLLSTALPTIAGELNGVDQMFWVITAFILVSTITMPVYGRLRDLFGRKHLLVLAISFFMLGSAAGALSGNMMWLIVSRTIQGLGGGGLLILSQTIIADVIPPRARGRYIGILGSVFAISSIVGPLLGGWFTEGPGWRWVFWINLPIGTLAMIAAVSFLRVPRPPSRHARIDWPGVLTLAVATTGLVFIGGTGGSRFAWNSFVILCLIGMTTASAALLFYIEKRALNPIIPLHIFTDRNFNIATLAGVLTVGITMFGTVSYMPTYLQIASGASATMAGLLMVPLMGSMVILSFISGRFVSYSGRYKFLLVVGSALVAAALILLSLVEVTTPLWVTCSVLALFGMGLGMTSQILVLIVQNSFPITEVGAVTAASSYFRQVGASLSTAIVGSIFVYRLSNSPSGSLPDDAALSTSGPNSITPALVNALPAEQSAPIVASFNEALMPMFPYIALIALASAILLCFLAEKPLAVSIEQQGVDSARAASKK